MKPRRFLGALAVAGVLSGGGVLGWRWFTTPRLTAAERGAALFQSIGCEGCHGPAAIGGVPNPGSSEKFVPGFIGGTAMMYVESERDLLEWIVHGHPLSREPEMAHKKALLEMPAFGDRLSPDQIDDLLAWYRVRAEFRAPLPASAAAGFEEAGNAGCFGCHGPGGQVGVANSGALKGYVPGWGSEDFFELVQSEQELREWIRDGVCRRLAENPIAEWFRHRAVLEMPSYEHVLTPQQIDAIADYIIFITGGWEERKEK